VTAVFAPTNSELSIDGSAKKMDPSLDVLTDIENRHPDPTKTPADNTRGASAHATIAIDDASEDDRPAPNRGSGWKRNVIPATPKNKKRRKTTKDGTPTTGTPKPAGVKFNKRSYRRYTSVTVSLHC
jgi:hypothetical protein